MTAVFTKEDEATLTGKFRVGAQWDPSGRGMGKLGGLLSRAAGADLDAVAVLFMGGVPVRMAGLDNNDPLKNGSVLHSGDNQTGKGEGDDETIDFDIARIDADVDKIVVMVAAFKEKNKRMGDVGFGGADNVEFSFYDADTTPPTKVFRILPPLLGRENCCIVAVLDRVPGGFRMTRSDAKVFVKHGDMGALLRAAVNA